MRRATNIKPGRVRLHQLWYAKNLEDEHGKPITGHLPADRMQKRALEQYKDYPHIDVTSVHSRESKLEHPVQPLHKEADGTIKFKQNDIVLFLLNAGPFDMNQLALMPWSHEDRIQFLQLIGYSLSGFGELSYVTDSDYVRADSQKVFDSV